jgi:hypothetical protein
MVSTLSISFKIRCQKVGKEKNFENSKHNNQLDYDDFPQRLADDHRTETIVIHAKNIFDHHPASLFVTGIDSLMCNKFGNIYTCIPK